MVLVFIKARSLRSLTFLPRPHGRKVGGEELCVFYCRESHRFQVELNVDQAPIWGQGRVELPVFWIIHGTVAVFLPNARALKETN